MMPFGFEKFLSDGECTKLVKILIDKGYLLERHSTDPWEILVALEFHVEDLEANKTKTIH
jgi:hypothetical protein